MYNKSREEEINLSNVKSVDIDEDADMDDLDEDVGMHFDPDEINVVVKQPTIYNLVQRMSANPSEIDMNTSFQRNADLWSKTNQSRLIESVLLRIQLPTFYFDGSDDDRWLIVDGLQRLSAFKAFIIDKTLKLTNLEYFTQFEGMKYDDLPSNMIRRIGETQIIAIIIQPGTPDEVKFNIFKRINTAGFNLNSQEIRHAVYHGEAADFIENLSRVPSFQRLRINPKRMADQELITRFVAFYCLGVDNYRPRMDDFLEKAMIKLKKSDEESRKQIESRFNLSMNRAYELFGAQAFKRQYLKEKGKSVGKINKAMFEVWSVRLANLSDDDYKKLKESSKFIKLYDALMVNESFVNSVSQGTAHKEAVLRRFSMVDELIKRCLI